MVCMSTKNLSQTHKLIARSMRRTCEAVEDSVRDAQRADIKFRGRKLGNEAWINSAVRYFWVVRRICEAVSVKRARQYPLASGPATSSSRPFD